MGHKVSPKIIRLGITQKWNSRWFGSGKDFVNNLRQDNLIREFLTKKLKEGGVEKIEIERSPDKIEVLVHSSKPGIIIGRGGAGIEEVKTYIIKNIIKNKKVKINLNIKEVSKPQLSASIVAQNVAFELEKRVPYRRAMKRNMENTEKAGALGIKLICSGRLNGADIARKETLTIGKIPLHTLRADIDYGTARANTTYGVIGIKVWIYKGEIYKSINQ
jgi:small subunit ribosomal protein S3